MKRRLAVPAFLYLLVVISCVIFFIHASDNLFKSGENSAPSGETKVMLNDIAENARECAAKGDYSSLDKVLDQNGCDAVLYQMDGVILFDSKDSADKGRKADLNTVLHEAHGRKTSFLLNNAGQEGANTVIAVIDTYEKTTDINKVHRNVNLFILALSSIFILLMLSLFLFVHIWVLRPFKRLEHFAGEVAKGNLELPFMLGRNNLFGAFSWAFDMMRSELLASRKREAEAEKTKKELVAVLSHDIRTPIASIMAYAECLEGLPDKNGERGQRYVEKILEKTREITKLSQDMFLHAISDLEKLEINAVPCESRALLNNILEPLILQYENRIIINSSFPDVKILADPLRLAQVFENILGNSVKYAEKSEIQIDCYKAEGVLLCRIRDFGQGVQPEDIPFLLDKFYRGKNAKDSEKPGSGLGLYISRYILEKTGGGIKAYNVFEEGERKGFAVEITLTILQE